MCDEKLEDKTETPLTSGSPSPRVARSREPAGAAGDPRRSRSVQTSREADIDDKSPTLATPIVLPRVVGNRRGHVADSVSALAAVWLFVLTNNLNSKLREASRATASSHRPASSTYTAPGL